MKPFKGMLFLGVFISFLSCSKNEDTIENLPDTRSDRAEISNFSFPKEIKPASINHIDHTIVAFLNEEANIQNLIPVITVSEGATLSPLSKEPQDFSVPVTYSVTSENGKITNTYTVEINQAQSILFPLSDFEKWYINSEINTEEPGENENSYLKTSNSASLIYGTIQKPNVIREEGMGYQGSTAIKLTTIKAEGDIIGTPVFKVEGMIETPSSAQISVPQGKQPTSIQFYYQYTPGEELFDEETHTLITDRKDRFQVEVFCYNAQHKIIGKITKKVTAANELQLTKIEIPAFSYPTAFLSYRFASSALGSYAFGSTLLLDNIKVNFQ